MIDREARNKLAESIRHLVSGRITNDDFECLAPSRSNDKAVSEITWQVWMLYSDLRTHKLTGPDALSKADRRTVARFILFLHSALEYEWAPHPLFGLLRLAVTLLSFGMLTRRVDEIWESAGDFEVWPFVRKADFDLALNKPKLLGGRAA
jgi:hypothetical protein